MTDHDESVSRGAPDARGGENEYVVPCGEGGDEDGDGDGGEGERGRGGECKIPDGEEAGWRTVRKVGSAS